jgi:hypothetical protein
MKKLFPVLCLVCAMDPAAAHDSGIDRRSYDLGIIGAFAEVVRLGVKELALSEVMAPETMDALIDDALMVAERNGVEIWRETDFLVTDLYPADVALRKDVLLIYTGDTLGAYLKIKEDKAKLVADGRYHGEARQEIARRFGRLLSYPEPVIDELLAGEKLLEQ